MVLIHTSRMSENGDINHLMKEARTEGITMSRKHTWGVPIAISAALCLIAMGFVTGNAHATDKHQTKLVGHSDLQARDTLQVTVKDHPSLNKVFVFVGHHRGVKPNPLLEGAPDQANGTTILDVTNPKKPVIVYHIPGNTTASDTAESRAVQVQFNPYGDGKDYLIRNQELRTPPPAVGFFEIFEITDTLREGSDPTWITNIAHVKPHFSLRPLSAAHKGWWYVGENDLGDPVSYYFGSASSADAAYIGKAGYNHLIIWDLSDISDPRWVATGWIFGQRHGEPDPPEGSIGLHHPIVDWENSRVHGACLDGGNVVVYDISSLTAGAPLTEMPVILNVDFQPPFPYPGPHSSLPFYDVDTPNFTPGSFEVNGMIYKSNPRDYIIVSDEGFRGDILGVACQDVRNHLYTIDITDFDHPVTVNLFKVPDGDFCENGKSVRPHQFNDTQNGEIYRPGDNNNLLFVAYFEKGLRILDYSDPYNPVEVGHFIPDATSNTKLNSNGVVTIMSNDVDLDSRGLAYVSDRAATGLHIIEYLGN